MKSPILLLLVFCVCFVHRAGAQTETNDSIWHSIEYVKMSEPRLHSENASFLKKFNSHNVSNAEIIALKSDGKFKSYIESEDSYNLGAVAESYYKVNPQIVFYGKVKYDYFKGKNMEGSVFLNPNENPFDIVEYEDSNAGNKIKERYNLVGAISANVYNGLTLGGRIDYTAANYTKTRDLRYKNVYMNMNLSVGATYDLSNRATLGLNYNYRRSTEELSFGIYGNYKDKFTSLISYGGFFGHSELFGENGYTEKNTRIPLFNEYHGVGLQIDYALSNNLQLFNEVNYKSRSGYYGKKSDISIVYSEHQSDIISYNGSLSFSKENNRHLLQWNLRNEKLENFENVYQSQTLPGGNTIYIYNDLLKALDRKATNISVFYTALLETNRYDPKWIFNIGVDYFTQKQTASYFPYYRKQTINSYAVNLSGKRNIENGINRFGLGIDLSYGSGSGDAKIDGRYSDASETQKMPATLDSLLYREFEYSTASRIKAELVFRFSRMLKDKTTGYIQLNYAYTKAFNIEQLDGDNYNQARIAIGYSF